MVTLTKDRDLDEVLQDISNYARETGVPVCVPRMTIYLWTDTDQKTCASITGNVGMTFRFIKEETLFSILRAINKATPIYLILIESHPFKAFYVTKTKRFMDKICEA